MVYSFDSLTSSHLLILFAGTDLTQATALLVKMWQERISLWWWRLHNGKLSVNDMKQGVRQEIWIRWIALTHKKIRQTALRQNLVRQEMRIRWIALTHKKLRCTETEPCETKPQWDEKSVNQLNYVWCSRLTKLDIWQKWVEEVASWKSEAHVEQGPHHWQLCGGFDHWLTELNFLKGDDNLEG